MANLTWAPDTVQSAESASSVELKRRERPELHVIDPSTAAPSFRFLYSGGSAMVGGVYKAFSLAQPVG